MKWLTFVSYERTSNLIGLFWGIRMGVIVKVKEKQDELDTWDWSRVIYSLG